MANDVERARRHWPTGSSLDRWQADERTYAALLNALTRDRLETEQAVLEMEAAPVVSMTTVQDRHRRSVEHELADARGELSSFRSALEDAWARSGPSHADEVTYDSRIPAQDDQADALIQYLVRTEYASVRTEEPETGHYLYMIRVNWPKLRDLASKTGHPLPD